MVCYLKERSKKDVDEIWPKDRQSNVMEMVQTLSKYLCYTFLNLKKASGHGSHKMGAMDWLQLLLTEIGIKV